MIPEGLSPVPFALGWRTDEGIEACLGVTPSWQLLVGGLDAGQHPHVLEIQLRANRGASFSCPDCSKACKAHNFKEFLDVI